MAGRNEENFERRWKEDKHCEKKVEKFNKMDDSFTLSTMFNIIP